MQRETDMISLASALVSMDCATTASDLKIAREQFFGESIIPRENIERFRRLNNSRVGAYEQGTIKFPFFCRTVAF